MPRSQKPNISLADAWSDIQSINPLEILTQSSMTFSEANDSLVWTWDKSGVYSAKSAYTVFSEGGMITWQYRSIWKCKIPPTVNFFTYLMLQGKILTRDVLWRGMNLAVHCEMCNNCPVESILHLLFLCPYAVTVWFEISSSSTSHSWLRQWQWKQSGTTHGIR